MAVDRLGKEKSIEVDQGISGLLIQEVSDVLIKCQDMLCSFCNLYHYLDQTERSQSC